MKLSKVILATIVVIALCFILASLSRVYIARKEVDEIRSLIAEIKAAKAPTCGEEIKPVVAPQDNAWPELEPFFVDRKAKPVLRIYSGDLAGKMLLAAQPRHQALLRKYLERYRSKVDRVRAILAVKPNFELPFEHKRGYHSPYMGGAIKAYAQNACLSAYEHGLSHETGEAVKDLVLARNMANQLFGSNNISDVRTANEISDAIVLACTRLIEFDSTMYQIPQEIRRQTGVRTPISQFLMQTRLVDLLETTRYLDDPSADKKSPIWPISMFSRDDLYTDDVPTEAAKRPTHPGDYMPESKAYRKALLATLRVWTPFIKTIQQHGSNYTPGMPQLDMVWNPESQYAMGNESYVDYTWENSDLENLRSSKDALMVLRHADTIDWSLDVMAALAREKVKSGKFPAKLPAQFDNPMQFTDFGGLIYTTTGKTCYIVSKLRNDYSAAYVKLGLPSSKVFNKNEIGEGLQLIYNYQKGLINRNGDAKPSK